MRADVQLLADRLWVAETIGRACPPLTIDHPELTLDQAYAISQRNAMRRQADGRRVAGYKAGLTSEAARVMFGADEPSVGVIFDEMVVRGGEVSRNRFIQPRVELEIVIITSDRLGPGQVSADDVLRSGARVATGIEIVDSRIADWQLSLVDTVAGNGSSGAVVVGATSVPIDALRPDVEGDLVVNGEVVGRGNGTAAFGSALAAAAWLAAAVSRLGSPIEPGHVLFTGTLVPPVPVRIGDLVVADLVGVGSTSVRFT